MAEQTIERLAEKLDDYLEPEHVRQIKHAYYYAEQAHDGQYRRSGEHYVSHPLAVAFILSDMQMDHESLMAAMLHDVIEDTGIPKQALICEFGDNVANLVDGVSKLTQIKFGSRAEQQAENFQKMAMAMAKDIRVILVKLADRLHNMRTLGSLKPEKKRRIARETLEMYAPIANRLGMNSLRIQFEDLGFEAMFPMRSKRIKAAIQKNYGTRHEVVEQIQTAITRHLEDEGIEARIVGREKHIYGIYQKMKLKNKSLSNIMDVYGFRIIVNRVEACYRVLGSIHSLYKPVPGYIKDYIAIPKSNGYQSLHTVLFSSSGVPIEIQIRTEEMEAMANNGIAAHWLYKSQTDSYNEAVSGSHTRARQWVQSLLEIQERTGNSLEFIENVKVDLFPDEVYVFTPKGEILELPQDSTPIDFAYAVHTYVGDHCVGCRINRRQASLSEPLENGQTIEIITSESAEPSPDWLNFVVSGKARSNIRHHLKQQRYTESIKLGERLLKKALASLKAELSDVSEEAIKALLAESGHKDFNYILEDIGLGNRVAFLTARQLIPDKNLPLSSGQTDAGGRPSDSANKPLLISGHDGMMINFARCCHPLPGDKVRGHLSAGRGIVVHLANCKNIADIQDNSTNSLQLEWSQELDREFPAELTIEVSQKQGIIAKLAQKINNHDANIQRIAFSEQGLRVSVIHAEVTVHNRVHLARIIKSIRSIKSVSKVTRVKNSRK